jgi:hypothetical protein
LAPGTRRKVRLFNRRRDKWTDHFCWVDDGEQIEGVTEIGRATLEALEMNHPFHIEARQNWIGAGWHPPP